MTSSNQNPEKAKLKIPPETSPSQDESEKREPFWSGPGYRDEYNCPHGVGHGNHIHGCDGCCQRDDFPLNEKNLEDTRRAEAYLGVGPHGRKKKDV